MRSEPTRETLQRIFRDVFEDDDLVIADETTAEDIADWTSIKHVELMVALESAFGIRFTTAEIAEFVNVGDLELRITAKQGPAV